MKNKKGFTLIELLATISILSVLMLIGVVSYNTVINNSKMNLALSNAKNYITGIEYKYNMEEENDNFKVYMVNNENLNNVLDSGDVPVDGAVVLYNNKVVQAKLCYDNDKSIEYYLGEYTPHDSSIYCNYIDNSKKEGNFEIINTDTLTEETKLVSLAYNKTLSSDGTMVEYAEASKEYGYLENTVRYDNYEVEEVKKLYSSGNVAKTEFNFNKETVKATKLESNELPSTFDLNKENLVTSVKEQKLSICWAYSGNGSVEIIGKKNNLNLDLSERQIDYFTLSDGIEGLTNNPYSSYARDGNGNYRNLNLMGGNEDIYIRTLSTALTVKSQNKFNDNNEKEQVNAKKVYNLETDDYYVKEAIYLDYGIAPFKENTQKRQYVASKLKQLIYEEKVGISVGICAKATSITPARYNGKKADVIVSDLKNYDLTGGYICGPHAVLIVGWDDNISYWDNDNFEYRTGAWIAKNSWGDSNNPYIYIAYDYGRMYATPMFAALEIEKKNWDNSYDSYNNIITSYNDTDGNVKQLNSYTYYFDKMDGKKEKVTSVGYLNYNDREVANMAFVPVKTVDECLQASNKDWFTAEAFVKNYKNTMFLRDRRLDEYGYKFFDIDDFADDYEGYGTLINEYLIQRELNGNNEFENDICVVFEHDDEEDISKLQNHSMTILTKNVDEAKDIKLETKIVYSSGNSHNIDTVVSNIESGIKVTYNVTDYAGSVINDVEIIDNVIVNGVAHSKFKFKYENEYYITATVTVNGKTYTSNKVTIKGERRDSIAPTCAWSNLTSKAIKGNSYSATLTCTDASGFGNVKIDKNDFGASSIKVKITEVSQPRVYSNGTKVSWTVNFKINKVFLFNSSSTLIFYKDSISDANGNKNKRTQSNTFQVVKK